MGAILTMSVACGPKTGFLQNIPALSRKQLSTWEQSSNTGDGGLPSGCGSSYYHKRLLFARWCVPVVCWLLSGSSGAVLWAVTLRCGNALRHFSRPGTTGIGVSPRFSSLIRSGRRFCVLVLLVSVVSGQDRDSVLYPRGEGVIAT